MRRSMISLATALALTSSIAYAGYGIAAGYSQTKYIDVGDSQWALVGMPGLAKYSTVVPDAISQDVNFLDGSSSPAFYYGNGAVGTVQIDAAPDNNATAELQASANYESILQSYFGSDYSVTDGTGPAILFTQLQQADMPGPYKMKIYLQYPYDESQLLGTINYDQGYAAPANANKSVLFALDSSNLSSFYSLTFQVPTAGDTVQVALIDDPNADSVKVWENVDLNSTGTAIEIAGSGSGLYNVLKEANLTVYEHNAFGGDWRRFDANSSEINGTSYYNNIYNLSDEEAALTKGKAYWYKTSFKDPNGGAVTEHNYTVTIRNDSLSTADLQANIATDGWSLVALNEGHIRFPQTGMVVDLTGSGANDEIDIQGLGGTAVRVALPMDVDNASVVNKAISDLNGSGTLNIRAYPIDINKDGTNDDGLILVGDHNFKLTPAWSGTPATIVSLESLGGVDLTDVNLGNEANMSIVGEQTLAFVVDEEYLASDIAGSLTIEIPNLTGTTGVVVESHSGITTAAGLATEIRSRLSETVDDGGAGLNANDYNVSVFYPFFDESGFGLNTNRKAIMISIKPDNKIPSTRDYKGEYLRFGIQDNTYVKPYAGLSNSSNYLVVKDLTGDDLNSSKAQTAANGKLALTAGSIAIKQQTNDDTNNDFNLTYAAKFNKDANYTYFVTTDRTLDIYEVNSSDVIKDVKFLSSSNRAVTYSDSGNIDLNRTINYGLVQNVFTLDDLSQAKLTSDGNLSNFDSEAISTYEHNFTVDHYSDVTDLTLNTVWSSDLPDSGPLYDLVTAGFVPTNIFTYSHRGDIKWHEIDLGSTFDPANWLSSDSLVYLAPENGYWVRTNSSAATLDTAIPTTVAETTGAKTVITHFDNTNNKTYNYVYTQFDINVDNTNALTTTTLLHNVKVGGTQVSGKSTSIQGESYEVYVDPFAFSDMSESGAFSKSVDVSNGYVNTSATAISTAYSKPAQINPVISGDSIGYTGSDTLAVHKEYIDENNSENTVVTLSGTTILPTSIVYEYNDWQSGEDNQTTLKLFVTNSDGLSSDLNETIYVPFNAVRLKTGETEYSEVNDLDMDFVEYLDADADGTAETYVIYEVLSDDGTDNTASTAPTKVDINGTVVTGTKANYNDGVQVLSTVSGKSVVMTYRPMMTSQATTQTTDSTMAIYDGSTELARIEFSNDYIATGSKFYLYSEETNSLYMADFGDGNITQNWKVDCSGTTEGSAANHYDPTNNKACYTVIDDSSWATEGDATGTGAAQNMLLTLPTTAVVAP